MIWLSIIISKVIRKICKDELILLRSTKYFHSSVQESKAQLTWNSSIYALIQLFIYFLHKFHGLGKITLQHGCNTPYIACPEIKTEGRGDLHILNWDRAHFWWNSTLPLPLTFLNQVQENLSLRKRFCWNEKIGEVLMHSFQNIAQFLELKKIDQCCRGSARSSLAHGKHLNVVTGCPLRFQNKIPWLFQTN